MGRAGSGTGRRRASRTRVLRSNGLVLADYGGHVQAIYAEHNAAEFPSQPPPRRDTQTGAYSDSRRCPRSRRRCPPSLGQTRGSSLHNLRLSPRAAEFKTCKAARVSRALCQRERRVPCSVSGVNTRESPAPRLVSSEHSHRSRKSAYAPNRVREPITTPSAQISGTRVRREGRKTDRSRADSHCMAARHRRQVRASWARAGTGAYMDVARRDRAAALRARSFLPRHDHRLLDAREGAVEDDSLDSRQARCLQAHTVSSKPGDAKTEQVRTILSKYSTAQVGHRFAGRCPWLDVSGRRLHYPKMGARL